MTREQPHAEKIETTKDPMERILESIMTAEEYGCMEHDVPYVFGLKSGETELHCFGAPHVMAPENPIFEQIKTAFTAANPDLVFIEGIRKPEDTSVLNERVRAMTEGEAIIRAGEAGFALKLAIGNGIDWHCPEPTDKDLYGHLLTQGFSKDDLFAREIFLMLPQYHRQTKKDGFREYIEPYIRRFEQETDWQDFDYSYERGIGIGNRLSGEDIDVENDPAAPDRIDPIPWEGREGKRTVLNRIGTAASAYRDRKSVKDMAEAMKTHERIFMVYGASHIVMQEPALRKLFT